MHFIAGAYSVRMEIGGLRPHADMFLLHALNASGPAALEPLIRALSWLGDCLRIPFRRRAGDVSNPRPWFLAAPALAIGPPVSAALTAGLKAIAALVSASGFFMRQMLGERP